METDIIPRYTYFQIPMVAPVRALDLSFAKCRGCPRFSYCPAIAAEKEFVRANFKDICPEVATKLAEDAYAQGQSEVNPILVERECKKFLDVHFSRDCVYETEATHKIVEHLAKDYDVTKGKNYLLIRELLSTYLINFRLESDITDNTIVMTFTTRSGDVMRIPHSGLKNKLEFSKLMLEYIKQLEAFSKDTVQIKIEGDFSMRQMLDRIIDLDKVEPPKRLN